MFYIYVLAGFNQWDLTQHLSHVEYASLFIQHNVILRLTGYLHKMPRMHATCLRGSELTPLVDAFFTQQHAETQQLNFKNVQRFIIIVFSL